MRFNLAFLFILFLLILLLVNQVKSQGFVSRWEVCAVGDSHVVPDSYFLRMLQIELGDEYHVYGVGRRGWSAQRWINSGDFASSCEGADIVLVSLGGNDRHNGVSWERIRERVESLLETLPDDVHVYHMEIPRYYRPRLSLGADGVHMTRAGARRYAEIVAPFLRLDTD